MTDTTNSQPFSLISPIECVKKLLAPVFPFHISLSSQTPDNFENFILTLKWISFRRYVGSRKKIVFDALIDLLRENDLSNFDYQSISYITGISEDDVAVAINEIFFELSPYILKEKDGSLCFNRKLMSPTLSEVWLFTRGVDSKILPLWIDNLVSGRDFFQSDKFDIHVIATQLYTQDSDIELTT